MDAPVLAIAAGLTTVAGYETSRLRGAPIGEGRVHAGVERTSEDAYRVLDVTFMTHIDPLTAEDSERNTVPETILAFVAANTESGTTGPIDL